MSSAVPPIASALQQHTSVRQLLENEARSDGARVIIEHDGKQITVAHLDSTVNGIASHLSECGVGSGDLVAVMLRHHPDHIGVFFALLKLGAILVPVNPSLKGPPLEFLIQTAAPKMVVADADLEPAVLNQLRSTNANVVVRGMNPGQLDFGQFWSRRGWPMPPGRPAASDVVEILFTSGTTGTPKGVLVTDSMHRAAAEACLLLSEVRDGDRLLFWEPIYHVVGTETLVLALLRKISLHLVDRFSASQLWQQARACKATHVHYVGGVLQMLLAQPASDQDRTHDVRLVWGGGVTKETWLAFAERFNVKITDGYGLTETSSPCVISTEDVAGSVGKPLPWIEAVVADEEGMQLQPGQSGEILVRQKVPGVLTPGYFNNPKATAALYRGDWLRTGDRGYVDDSGNFFYLGRMTDSVRRRGENISAWEVERVVNDYPGVAESALIGVPDEIGDQALKIFVRATPGAPFDVVGLANWCRETLPRFQVPRFYELVEDFDRTPSLRIKKAMLDRGTVNCFDLEGARK